MWNIIEQENTKPVSALQLVLSAIWVYSIAHFKRCLTCKLLLHFINMHILLSVDAQRAFQTLVKRWRNWHMNKSADDIYNWEITFRLLLNDNVPSYIFQLRSSYHTVNYVLWSYLIYEEYLKIPFQYVVFW